MARTYTEKEMENAVMLAADFYQRMCYSHEIDGGALEVAGAIIEEAVNMEKWLTEKYGEDDDCYLDRLDEYEEMMVKKYELNEEDKKMKQTIKEVALDYIDSERECNFYAANRNLMLRVFGQSVDVESIWMGEDHDKVFLHCGCKEFEADIDIESLSYENQERVREVLKCVNLTSTEVRNLTKQWADVPLVFLFRVDDVDREEVDTGMSREECFKRCADYYLLSELGDAWNDTDDDERRMPEVKNTWCYVSQPEKKEPKPWEFDEQAFIEQYCPMEGGNDYLGWIDDIYKLLHGEAEPGDAASTGDYANMSEEELRKELKRLTAIVLHQAIDRYVEQNY